MRVAKIWEVVCILFVILYSLTLLVLLAQHTASWGTWKCSCCIPVLLQATAELNTSKLHLNNSFLFLKQGFIFLKLSINEFE